MNSSVEFKALLGFVEMAFIQLLQKSRDGQDNVGVDGRYIAFGIEASFFGVMLQQIRQ